jgi:hypothetical protein
MCGRRRWICDLRDEIRCGGFSNSINEDTQKRNSLEDVESNAKAKQNSLSVMEPMFLLFLGKFYARKVWFELGNVSREERLRWK